MTDVIIKFCKHPKQLVWGGETCSFSALGSQDWVSSVDSNQVFSGCWLCQKSLVSSPLTVLADTGTLPLSQIAAPSSVSHNTLYWVLSVVSPRLGFFPEQSINFPRYKRSKWMPLNTSLPHESKREAEHDHFKKHGCAFFHSHRVCVPGECLISSMNLQTHVKTIYTMLRPRVSWVPGYMWI